MLAVAVVLVPALLFAAIAAHDRVRLLDGLANDVRNRTDIFCQHALNVFETHRLIADHLATLIAGLDWDEVAGSETLAATLRTIHHDYPQVQAVWLADATGRFRAATDALPARPVSAASRDYFPPLRAGAERSFGGMVRGMITGRINFNFARRLQRPDGSFDGAVVTSVYTGYFRDFWLSVAPQPFLATLVRSDGRIMMRIPEIDPKILMLPADSAFASQVQGRDSGSFRSVSKLDGIERFFSFRRIGGYDAYVIHGADVQTALATWHRHLLAYGTACAAAAATLLGLVLLALRFAAATEQARAVAEMRQTELESLVATLARTERSARFSEAQYRALAEYSSDAIIRTSIDGIHRYLSPSILHLTGYRPEELIGRHWTSNLHPDDRPIVERALGQLRDGAARAAAVYRMLHKDGPAVWIEAHCSLVRNPATGAAEKIITVARDITARRTAEQTLAVATEELAQQAMTDSLTGLANRRHFDQALEQEWRRACRESEALSLLMIDADCFKLYNDHYGHLMGDQVLRAIADSIRANIRRPGDTGARYGGEEFAVILPNTDPDGAIRVAEAIRHGVAGFGMPHQHGSGGIVTVSIGVASVIPTPEAAVVSLIAGADQALYAAKTGGRNQTRCTDGKNQGNRGYLLPTEQ